MQNLSKKEASQFVKAFRSTSQPKLAARDFTRLSKPLYNDYLHHVKRYAGSSAKKDRQEDKKIQAIVPPIQPIPSHYYCQKNELLSLKQFIILMEQSRKKSQRDEKNRKRELDRKSVQDFEKNIQHFNPVNLRMTTSFVNKAKYNRKNSGV